METLLLHQNMIVDVPSSLYRLKNLKELSLDWFAYLNAEYVGIHTKHLKIRVDKAKGATKEEEQESVHHARVVTKFLDLCKLVQIQQMKKEVE